MQKIYNFCKKVPSKLFLLEKKIKHGKTMIEFRQYEDELMDIKNSFGEGNIYGDVSCYSLTDPEWLVEKYQLKGGERKKFIFHLPEIIYLLQKIQKLEKKIEWKIMYFKVMEILQIYDEKMKNGICFDRKTNENVWNTDFDIFLDKKCPWNILLQERRKLFSENQEPMTRKEEYEMRKYG